MGEGGGRHIQPPEEATFENSSLIRAKTNYDDVNV